MSITTPSSSSAPVVRTVQTIAPVIPRHSPPGVPVLVRPQVRGKFIFAGDSKLFVRGVTYGAFRPNAAGQEYHDPDAIERDFAQMAEAGVNAVRIPHTTPPTALLDAAARHDLRVMVGLSAEQYLGFLIDRKKPIAPAGEDNDRSARILPLRRKNRHCRAGDVVNMNPRFASY